MKKNAFIIVLSVLSLTGCNSSVIDNEPAIAEITTSSGDSGIYTSFNASSIYSGSERALKNNINIELADGEIANIHFYCSKCGHDKTEAIEAPFAKMFSCDCSEKNDDSGNAREYISITAETKTTIKE